MKTRDYLKLDNAEKFDGGKINDGLGPRERAASLISSLTKKERSQMNQSTKKSTLSRLIRLMPYGDELMTEGAAVWFFVAGLLVFLMALAESLSWGFLVSLLVPGSGKLFFASLAGFLVFVFIWCTDATLMTLDRSRSYQEMIFGESTKVDNGWLKDLTSVFVRMVIVSGSLLITAPFLSQFVYNTSIEAEIKNETFKIAGSKRTELMKEQTKSDETLKKEISRYHSQLEDEISGKRKSGAYGDGPVAKAIREKIGKKEAELETQQRYNLRRLEKFDSLMSIRNFDAIGSEYGIALPTNNIVERGKIVTKILSSGVATDTELAIRGFLLFLFCSLVVLKILEPRSVKLYLSEAIHQAWVSYLGGAYDQWIGVDERANGKARMSPFRFEDFMINTYAKRRAEDEQEKKDSIFHKTKQQVSDIRSSLEEERDKEIVRVSPLVSPLHAQLEELSDASEGLRKELDVVIRRRTAEVNKMDSIEREIEQLIKHGDPKVKDYTEVSQVNIAHGIYQVRKVLEDKKRLCQEELKKLELDYDALNNEINKVAKHAKELAGRISDIEKKAVEIEQRIQEIDAKALNFYTERAKAIFDNWGSNKS